MEKFETNHDENQENWPVIIGFLWAPWLWKTVAMHVVENEENLKDVKESLGREEDVTVGVARKATLDLVDEQMMFWKFLEYQKKNL